MAVYACKACKEILFDWTVSGICRNCQKEGKEIVSKYKHEYIPHSGGCCPLVEFKESVLARDENYLYHLGWAPTKTNENRWFGPWIDLELNWYNKDQDGFIKVDL